MTEDTTAQPWPIDPPLCDMAYVAVCPDCHGMAFVCTVDSAIGHRRTLIECLKRGHDLHRLPSEHVRNPAWFMCCCHRPNKEMPHG